MLYHSSVYVYRKRKSTAFKYLSEYNNIRNLKKNDE